MHDPRDPGDTRAKPVPAWMASTPNTLLRIARGGRAYAVLPLGAKVAPCAQRVQLVAPDGTACGARDYPIAPGACVTNDLALGADGTVIQPLPDSLEAAADIPEGHLHTCTWRWWSGALR